MVEKKLKEKNGAALVIALVIMLLLVMLSAALLLASYSLYNTSYRQRNVEQCKEIAQGISRELHAEIMAKKFLTETEVREALTPKNDSTNSEYPLWAYLRCNLWQSSWPYFNEEEARHQKSDAYRSFTLDYTGSGAEKIPGEVTVVMYRESSRDDDEKINGGSSEFYIEVTCQIGKQKSTITSRYELVVTLFDKEADPDAHRWTPVGSFNPANNEINTNEKWEFSGGELE